MIKYSIKNWCEHHDTNSIGTPTKICQLETKHIFYTIAQRKILGVNPTTKAERHTAQFNNVYYTSIKVDYVCYTSMIVKPSCKTQFKVQTYIPRDFEILPAVLYSTLYRK